MYVTRLESPFGNLMDVGLDAHDAGDLRAKIGCHVVIWPFINYLFLVRTSMMSLLKELAKLVIGFELHIFAEEFQDMLILFSSQTCLPIADVGPVKKSDLPHFFFDLLNWEVILHSFYEASVWWISSRFVAILFLCPRI